MIRRELVGLLGGRHHHSRQGCANDPGISEYLFPLYQITSSGRPEGAMNKVGGK
jgi:hypothetical protein